MYFLLNIIGLTAFFCGADALLKLFKLEGRYYLLHSIHNAGIVALTYPDIYHTLADFGNLQSYEVNHLATQLCFSLHFYHIISYFRKLRPDDWLHHILMIGFALPFGYFVEAYSLLGFSLFFTTGLPGGIDYFLLFLVRNFWLNRLIEKKVNTWLAVWIRSPGCVAQATLTLTWLLSYRLPNIPIEFSPDMFYFIGGLAVAFLNYWNGQYFMAQVVTDLAQKRQEVLFNSV